MFRKSQIVGAQGCPLATSYLFTNIRIVCERELYVHLRLKSQSFAGCTRYCPRRQLLKPHNEHKTIYLSKSSINKIVKLRFVARRLI